MKIEIKNLSKVFGEKEVLNNLNLTVKDGERIALMGKSGSGKTTLINCILGLEDYTGEIIFSETPVPKTVLQDNVLFENFTVFENIKAVGDFSKEEVLSHLKLLGLSDEIDTYVRDLSGGMKRRVAIIRAVIYPGNLFIMDEGVREVDEYSKELIYNYINENVKDTMVFATHNMEDVEKLKGKVLSLD